MLKPNSPMTTKLIKARELIADESKWCRGTLQLGDAFCAIGALGFVGEGDARFASPGLCFLGWAASEQGYVLVSALNDEHPDGHAAVMRMFNRAIELSLQEASE